jgi:hypothetical protein
MSLSWMIAGVVALVSLGFSWQKRNAIWGGLTIGVVLGLLFSSYLALTGSGFSWLIVTQIATVATLIGLGGELLGMASDEMKKRI